MNEDLYYAPTGDPRHRADDCDDWTDRAIGWPARRVRTSDADGAVRGQVLPVKLKLWRAELWDAFGPCTFTTIQAEAAIGIDMTVRFRQLRAAQVVEMVRRGQGGQSTVWRIT